MLIGKDVLKICQKFTGEHPCRSLISIKLQNNFIEITLRHKCSPVNLLHIFRTPFYKNTLGNCSCFLLFFYISNFIYLKVARVGNLKLIFRYYFFYNLVILIKLYKIRYLNLDKALLFPRNQAICLKNWKLWRAPTASKFNNFCLNFAHVSCLTMSTKACSGFFLFCLDLELLIKV